MVLETRSLVALITIHKNTLHTRARRHWLFIGKTRRTCRHKFAENVHKFS